MSRDSLLVLNCQVFSSAVPRYVLICLCYVSIKLEFEPLFKLCNISEAIQNVSEQLNTNYLNVHSFIIVSFVEFDLGNQQIDLK